MAGSDLERPIFQFGVFELDPRSGELRKRGIKLKLQDQPLQVLILLLERAGQVVTREDLQKRLWPENTHVDFDNAINSAVRKLRDALGDSAENPRFIETLARRGYRFIGHVKGGEPAETEPVPPVAAPPAPPQSRKGLWVAAAALTLALASGIGVYSWQSNRRGASSEAPEAPVPLTTYPGYQRFPAFSPEGSRVAFAWDEPGKRPSNIYVKLIGPTEPVRLTHGEDGDVAPAWSPDGRYIAFLRRHGIQSALMLVPAVGGEERELTRLQFDITDTLSHWLGGWVPAAPYIAWSPDSKWLFSLAQSGVSYPARIVRISAETGEKTILALSDGANESDRQKIQYGNSGGGESGITLSPDGHKLAFVRNVAELKSVVYVVGVSGQLLPNERPARLRFERSQIEGIAWDLEGRSVVVSSNRRGIPELWRIPLSSGEPARLSVGDASPSDVAVSPAGRHLVYSHSSSDSDIWRIGLTGSHPKPTVPFLASTRNEARPAYSPDGTRIAFESARSGNEEVWTSNADASGTVQITSFGNAWAGSPAWSPDGKQIAFDGNAAGDWDVYVVSSAGGRPFRLTTSSAREMRPAWSHDGRWIYYCSAEGGADQIWKKPPTGGDAVQVTKQGGCDEAAESADGKTLYYLKDNTAVWKVSASGGGEAEVLPIGNEPHFALAKKGVYFNDLIDTRIVKLFDFQTHSVRPAVRLSGPANPREIVMVACDKFAVSPDEQWMLFEKVDLSGSELMLVENFR